jgi:predicted dehydrogenase
VKSNNIKKKPILILGAGSIGERYIRILSKKGFKNIIVLRRKIKKFRNIDNAKVEVLTNFEEAIKLNPFAAIVCTPTSNHMEECLKLTKNKIHVLVEKPISHNINGFDELSLELNKNKSYLQVGYMLRFHPLIQNLKDIIQSKIYGNLVCTRSVWAEYLPNWHPWENYKESYAAKKELGGGVSLTLSHDIDLTLYLVNSKIKTSSILNNYSSNLGINVETASDILIEFDNGVTSNIHLNFFELKSERFYKLVFDEATVIFNYNENKIDIFKKNGSEKIISDKFYRDLMFEKQIDNFIANVFEENAELLSVENLRISKEIIKICNNEK